MNYIDKILDAQSRKYAAALELRKANAELVRAKEYVTAATKYLEAASLEADMVDIARGAGV